MTSADASRYPEPIAIIGMGCRFPGAKDVPAFWHMLTHGIDAIEEVPPDRWDVDKYYDPDPNKPGKVTTRYGGFLHDIDKFDAYFFGISPREAAHLDPRQRMLLEVTWEALEDAGIPPDSLAGTPTGVFIAVINNEYGGNIFREPELVDAYTATGNAESIPANRLSYVLDLRGPSMTLDTACSGSLVAVHLACQSLHRGESTLALVGGVNLILNVDSQLFFSRAGALAPDGRCKTFDARANGIVRSDGVGLIVLKPLSKALADNDQIYAVIRGSGVNQDGRTNGIMAPNPESQQALLREVYEKAGISPLDVQYVEAHGTGTRLGDPIEVQSIGAVLCEGRPADRVCVLGSVKTNVGHMESAAGVAGVMKVALAMRHRLLPPSLHFQTPNPLIPFDTLPLKVQTSLGPWPCPDERLIAGVSSFGFGGTNAHVILEEAPCTPLESGQEGSTSQQEQSQADQPASMLLPISARTRPALQSLAQSYRDFLSDPELRASLRDVCYTAARRRAHLEERAAIVFSSREEAISQLEALIGGEPRAGLALGSRPLDRQPRLAFVFSGQGSHWPGMGLELMRREPVFRASLEACDELLRMHAGWSLLEELARPEHETRLNETHITQPAIFALQVALAALWRSWGIQPEVIVGQSLGEVAAAHVAGALSLEDALLVVYHRSRLMQRTAGQGRTAVVGLPLDQAELTIASVDDLVSVAGSNSPTSSVLSGDPEALDKVLQALERRGVFCRLLRGVDVAFHSPQMDPIRGELVESLRQIKPRPTTIPLFSTVTGALIEGTELDAEYWGRNLRDPFLFTTVAQHLIKQEYTTFLEVSPHPVLSASILEGLRHAGRDGAVLPSLRRQEPEQATLLASLGTLWAGGQAVDWAQIYPQGTLTRLPTYAWQRERYWYDQLENPLTGASSKGGSQGKKKSSGDHPLVGESMRSSLPGGQIFWETELSPQFPRYLADHRVQGALVVPGVSYLEMALATATRSFGTPTAGLKNVEFKQVMVLPEEGARRIQCIFTPEVPGSASFQILSAPAEGDLPPEAWMLHAAGKVQYAPQTNGEVALEQVSLDEIRARCAEEIPGSDHYTAMSERGLQYGPAFQAIRHLWRRDGEALGHLKLISDLEYETRHYLAHPALLDGCLQVVAATVPTGQTSSANETFIPVGVKSLKIARPIGAEVWCQATLKDGESPDSNIRQADLRLISPEGEVVAEIEGLRLQRISGRAGQINAGEWLYELQWHARTLPEEEKSSIPLPAANWLIFADSDGLALALAARLEERGDSCILVAPGDAYSLSDEGRRAIIDPSQPEDYSRLLAEVAALSRRNYKGVIHLWSLNIPDAADCSSAALIESQQLGIKSLLHLDKALADVRQTAPPALWLITRGAQRVQESEAAPRISQAPLWGMVRAMAHEHPELGCRIVDLDPSPDIEAEARLLCDELWAGDSENQIALRGGQRYVARLARFTPTPLYQRRIQATEGQQYSLNIIRPGLLNTLTLQAGQRRKPGPGEVEIKVSAVGLNFKDIMYAMGFISDPTSAEVPLGLEFAGTVVDVGEGVEHLKVGDKVIGGGGHCFSRYLTRPVWNLYFCPPGLTPEEGAGLITAFGTTHYCLNHLAKLKKGERVLIHSATGGVGLAAIQLAQLIGAEIFATAGTPEKRDYLRSLGIKHVMDSRSLEFADEIMEITNGEGVDVVLNSLPGEGIRKGLAVLRPFGRFIEIGKRDILQNSPIGLGFLEKNISFFVFELSSLMQERGPVVWSSMVELTPLFLKGMLKPLPTRVFELSEVEDAFHYLRQGKHIGKVVVRLPENDSEVQIAPSAPAIRDDATYLLTGGLGGLGLTFADWLVERGARHIVLMSRSARAEESAQQLERWRAAGANVVLAQADVSHEEQVANVLEDIRRSMPPLKGVIHAAGVLDDGLLIHMTEERFDKVLAPKIQGAWNLHRLTSADELDFMILCSSVASLLGAPGQTNYAAGNAFMDALVHHRRAQGLPALSINWGPWAEVGMAARQNLGEQHARGGIYPIKPAEGVAILEYLLNYDPTQVAAMSFDVQQLQAMRTASMVPPLLTLLADSAEEGAPSGIQQGSYVQEVLLKAPAAERPAILEAHLLGLVARVLRIDQSRLTPHQPLNSLGIDSIMAVELQNYIKGSLGLTPSIANLLQGATVAQLAAQFLPELEAEDEQIAELLAEAENLPEEELEALLADELLLSEDEDRP
ncbi:MAG: polyketide synthase [Herpetosiphonaceae bacterium]|nr:MAG: polyketide synthase [Herpetosiphonaceae bacterium]